MELGNTQVPTVSEGGRAGHLSSLESAGVADKQLSALSRVINMLTSEERELATTDSEEGLRWRGILSAISRSLTENELTLIGSTPGWEYAQFMLNCALFFSVYEVGLNKVQQNTPTLVAMALCQTQQGARARVTLAIRNGTLDPKNASVSPELLSMALCQTKEGAQARDELPEPYELEGTESLWSSMWNGFKRLLEPESHGKKKIRPQLVLASEMEPVLAGFSSRTRNEIECSLTEAGLLPDSDDELFDSNVYSHDPN